MENGKWKKLEIGTWNWGNLLFCMLYVSCNGVASEGYQTSGCWLAVPCKPHRLTQPLPFSPILSHILSPTSSLPGSLQVGNIANELKEIYAKFYVKYVGQHARCVLPFASPVLYFRAFFKRPSSGGQGANGVRRRLRWLWVWRLAWVVWPLHPEASSSTRVSNVCSRVRCGAPS